jgi:GDPmannose 4,6-dehydratase
MKAIVFGAQGQDGYYLTKLLESRAVETIGVSRNGGEKIMNGNVTDWEFVKSIITQHKPDFIFHLAANSTTRHDALLENHETISTGTLNILESVKNFSPKTKVFITGSGVQFQNDGKPISEKAPFEANNAYAISRIQSVYAARYFRSLGVMAYVGYLFHHESPLRKKHHVAKQISEHVQRVRNGDKQKLSLGDISVIKEWSFAGDIVEGIYTLVNQEDIFETVIGSGKTYSIEEWLSICFEKIDADWKKYIQIVNSGFVPEYKTLVSDPVTINKLGWTPHTSIDQLANMMING